MQKTKKIHHKSNTKHGKKRKVRTIKHPKKNIHGGSYLDESGKINEQNQQNQESKNNNTSTSSWRNMFSGENKHPFTNLNFNSQPTVNNPTEGIVPEGIVKDRVENYENYVSNNNKTTNRPESVGSELTTNSLRGPTQAILAANRLSEGPQNPDQNGTWTETGNNSLRGPTQAILATNHLSDPPGGGPVGPKQFFPGQLKRDNAFRGNIGENDDVAEPDPNATGNVVEASGQGAESLLTTNSEGDLRSPEEFAQGSRPPLGVSDPLPMLPPGFRTTVDEQSGRLIYHNDNNSTASWYPPTVDNIVPELGTIYIVRYRNNNGAISEKEVFKHINNNPGNYTRYIFDDNNIPRECNLGIYDIGVEIKKKYEPKCEEISLEPLGNVR